MTDRPWTPGDDDILRSMREEDLPRDAIAKRLRRSVTAIAHRIDKLGLAKPYFAWTPAADARLREMREQVPPAPFSAIGAELGCSRNAAIGRANRIGCTGHGRGPETRPRKPKSEGRKNNFRATNMERRLASRKPAKVIELRIPYAGFLNIGIFDIGSDQCRYSQGEGLEIKFCAQPVVPGTSWCAHCSDIVYDRDGTNFSRRKVKARELARAA